jgi:hypothetical protein
LARFCTLALLLSTVAVAPAGAAAGHARSGRALAGAGASVAGLTLTQAAPPSPLPAKLPAGQTYTPPPGTVLQGVAMKPLSAYVNAVGKHPAVYQEFVAWGQWLPTITQDATANRARLMMMVSTNFGSRDVITPAAIAKGGGDAWLIGLAQQLSASGNITYMRLMAEMNNCENSYAADNCNGSSRGPAFSPATFKLAWRRVTLIMRGGPVSLIDRALRRMHLPRLQTTLTYLPTPKVSMVWVPMVGGNPDVPGLAPSVYYPGRRWVDWVGTDFYSRYPNWAGLSDFYSSFGGAPFAFGEYAIWDGDNPDWVKTLFGWISGRPRVQMLVYNDDSPVFYLSHFPASSAALHSALAAPKFLAYAPEWAPRS